MTVRRSGWLSSDHVSHIRRRILIASALFAIPPFAFPQQKRAVPVIGLLGSMSADSSVKQLAGVRAGLTAFGYVDGQSVEIRALWADGHYERLPRLVDDFIKANVDVILAGGLPAAEAAKAATAKIPIVFV